MKASISILVAIGGLFCFGSSAFGQGEDELQNAMSSLGWTNGPTQVGIADVAQVDLPTGYTYLDSDDTAVLMEMFQNPTSVEEYFVGPDDLRWWAVFSFDESGYVQDDEEIDPDSLLASIREGNEYSNRERRERGWSELKIVGWEYQPFYEPDTNRLAWAIRAESEGEPVVNYNTRLLGRNGVMSVVLVASPETLAASVDEFKQVLAGFNYDEGKRYADFVPGDKVATYGLAALVTGGAAAAVAKSGLGKVLFKFIGVGVIAVFAAASGFLKRVFRKKTSDRVGSDGT